MCWGHGHKKDMLLEGINFRRYPICPSSHGQLHGFLPIQPFTSSIFFISPSAKVQITRYNQNRVNTFPLKIHLFWWWTDTDNSLTGPCLHHKYVLKTSISACSHCDACLRTESGRIIRSPSLWFTGSSELDSTRSGAHRNSTVALYSWKLSPKNRSVQVMRDFWTAVGNQTPSTETLRKPKVY